MHKHIYRAPTCETRFASGSIKSLRSRLHGRDTKKRDEGRNAGVSILADRLQLIRNRSHQHATRTEGEKRNNFDHDAAPATSSTPTTVSTAMEATSTARAIEQQKKLAESRAVISQSAIASQANQPHEREQTPPK